MNSEDIMKDNAGRYTAEERELARRAMEYLNENGLCLRADFYKESPPSHDIREFLTGGRQYFDLYKAAISFLEDGLDQIAAEWQLEKELDELRDRLVDEAIVRGSLRLTDSGWMPSEFITNDDAK